MPKVKPLIKDEPIVETITPVETIAQKTAELSAKGKTAMMVVMLTRAEGATLTDMAKSLGWKENSIRGAMSTCLKNKIIKELTSEVIDGNRHYKAKI